MRLARVIEYLGLPGVGKTWQLGEEGYCRRVGGAPLPVPLGFSLEKTVNIMYGLLLERQLLSLLVGAALESKEPFVALIRPLAVLFERIGRIARLRHRVSERNVHIDEGPFQALWGVFRKKEPTRKNVELLARCVMVLQSRHNHICYVSCRRDHHVNRILRRKKRGDFDLRIAGGDLEMYHRARWWMAVLLRIVRRANVDVVWIRG